MPPSANLARDLDRVAPAFLKPVQRLLRWPQGWKAAQRMKVQLDAGTTSCRPSFLNNCRNVQPHSHPKYFRRSRHVPIPCRICDMKSGRGNLDILDTQILSKEEKPLNP